VQYSKFGWSAPASGQKHELPHRSIDVRFAPNKQTLTERVQYDAMCQKRNHAPQQNPSLDYLVRS
jgi:hypothetical protein